ncbi:MAG TPA: hypothetical protein VKS60_07320 [Stellaceae bacterium]|nr:hypothetical protein [Stellaceae bacterium]
MDDSVMVPIPVSPEAAAALRTEENQQRIGRLVSDLLRPSPDAEDPLASLIAELKAEVQQAGLTDVEIEAELAAYNAERRH